MPSLRELNLMLQLEQRMSKINRSMAGLPPNESGETIKAENQKYLLEPEEEIRNDLDADLIKIEEMDPDEQNKIYDYVQNTIMPQQMYKIKMKIDDYIKSHPYTTINAPGKKFYYPVNIDNIVSFPKLKSVQEKSQNYMINKNLFNEEYDKISDYNNQMKQTICVRLSSL